MEAAALLDAGKGKIAILYGRTFMEGVCLA